LPTFFYLIQIQMSAFYNYMVTENPMGCSSFLGNLGVNPSKNPQELAYQMASAVDQLGERAKPMLAEIHPDKELYTMASANFSNANGYGGGYSNACGGCGGYQSANGNGQVIKSDVEKLVNGKGKDGSDMQLLVFGGIVIFALAVILKK
jgi:hypothetical protein